MQVILYSSLEPKELAPITDSLPDSMLPVLNKTITEFSLELLFRNKIRHLTLLLSHLPYEAKLYFGQGERWGETIEYITGSAAQTIPIKQLASKFQEPLLFLPINIVSNLNIEILLEEIASQKYDMVFIHSGQETKWQGFTKASDFFYLGTRALERLQNAGSSLDLPKIIETLQQEELQLQEFITNFNCLTIKNLQDLLNTNLQMLHSPLVSLTIANREVEDKLFIGPSTIIEGEREKDSPIYLGAFSTIKGKKNYIKNSILGNNCMVETDARIENSLIFSDSFIGAYTEVKDAIVFQKYLIHPKKNISIYISDDFVIGHFSSKKENLPWAEVYFQRFLAFLYFILFLPVTTLVLVLQLTMKKEILIWEECESLQSSRDLDGKQIREKIKIPFFQTKIPMLDKLPALWQVLVGKQLLIGVSALSVPQKHPLYDLYHLKKDALPGIIRLWEIEGQNVLEEKLLSEIYYTKNRTFLFDIKTLLKFFTRFR
ncbi:MAG: sugar transferase [Spirochaetota bacterium]